MEARSPIHKAAVALYNFREPPLTADLVIDVSEVGSSEPPSSFSIRQVLMWVKSPEGKTTIEPDYKHRLLDFARRIGV